MVLLKSAASHLGRKLLNPVRAIEKLAKRLPRSEELGHALNALKLGRAILRGDDCHRDVRQVPNRFDEAVLDMSGAEQIDVERLGIF